MKTQLFLGSKPEPDYMKPVINRDFIKADGGLWTSTFNGESSSWIRWCEDNDFWKTDHQQGWLLDVRPDAKVLMIDSLEDLNMVFDQYGSMLAGFFAILDFEEIAKSYDGIHLTEKGQWETRFSHPVSLYGWDCECIFWFRWVFEQVRKVDIEMIQR